jgi:hypothetical protein
MSKSQGTIDLENERAKATFPVAELTNFIFGGAENVKQYQRLKQIVESDPVRSSFPFPVLWVNPFH